MRSVRTNLMLGIGVVTTGIFLSAATAIFLLARASLVSEFDATTVAQARTVAGMMELDEGKIKFDEDQAQLVDFGRAHHPEYFQIWMGDGMTFCKSKSLGHGDLDPPADMNLSAPLTRPLRLPDGRAGREAFLPFVVHGEPDQGAKAGSRAVAVVARQTRELDEMLTRLGWLLGIVSAIAVTAVLTLSALVIRRGLRPVDDLAQRITRIGAQNLSERLAATSAPKELSPIVQRLNDLLGRLESAFDREKSFTADAAHELRTPLAGLESALEVCARKDRAPEAYATVVRECLDVVRGMHGMIDNLLVLARADAGQIPVAVAPVQVDDLLEDAFARFKAAARNRSLDVQWDVPPDLTLQTDRDKLLHVLNNLLDNAVCHADAGGHIRISAQRNNGNATIRISNTGSRLSGDEAANVFERFWRGDPARSEIGVHCGLGLSVCKKMMAVLRGSIRAESDRGGEFAVEITLPAGKVHSVFMVAT
jgi:two-component system OmpR family sensor kinase